MGINILIVDDEAEIRYLLSSELRDAGYQVFESSNTKEFFEILEREKIDLCVLDIKLKGESGIDILKTVNEKYKGMKTLLSTAYSAYQDDFSTWTADGYWVKSQDISGLIDEVKKVLKRQ